MKFLSIALGLAAVLVFVMVVRADQPAGKGFDQFGYNNTARTFVGTCKSWYLGKFSGTEADAESYCGIYSNDKLVMKWNAEWDRGNDESWSDAGGYEAWLDNEWNGMKDGSGEVWHYKIKWDSGCATSGVPSTEGGYCIWGEFVTLMDQGTSDGEHFWFTKANPNGYGVQP